ncbi:hypothetical protein QTP86_013312 [Hemibagrus guttatus]|nr:hypothetical protein QTP86_013312 [Hemibagrus guttatus]
MLQDCFESTNWAVFKTAALREDSTVDLEEYAAAVTGYISTCTENIIPTKYCKFYPNDKPWINCEVRAMLRARSTAFVSEDIGEYKKARYKLCKSIRKAKKDYSLRLEGYYTIADSWHMWQGLQHITEYWQRSQGDITPKITLPDELNEFYARFEAPNTGQQHKTLTSEGILDTPLTVSSAEVRMALRKTNPKKAAGPDNIPGQALMVCSSELANLFTAIYNLSLNRALVPTCFKSTIIIPLPKKNTVTCLYDFRPIALTPIVMKCFERIVMSHIKSNIPTTLDAAIHTALTYLEGKDTYVRMLFINYSSAFNSYSTQAL